MKKCIALLLASLLLLTGCAASPDASADPITTQKPADIDTKDMDFTFTERELAGTWDVKKAILITGNGNTFKASGSGVKLADGQLIITSPGVYRLTGEFTGLPIIIRAGETDKVQLVLDNAQISSTDGPAILAESANKVFITLPEGTHSSVSDSATYTLTEAGSPDAVIFSRADLCLNGAGSLTVTGQYKHGVVSKDDLVIAGCSLQITAASTAFDGKDCIKASDAALTLTAGSNGLRSDNAENESRGFIRLVDSSITIVSGGDGIQAQTVLWAENSRISVTSGGGSDYTLRSADASWKGLKSGGDMLLDGGEYTISSRDDCIHTNSSLVIHDGSFSLSSGDDGIHADADLTINGGTILISKSYEGIEASKLTIAGGNITLTASDDGLNAAGGADSSGMGNRFGRGMFSNGVGEIIISSGYTVINAAGDGIDSNGSISVSGGVTLVSGPTSSGNAAFDYDGSATVSGGVLIAAGASGMAQNFSDASNQGAMLLTFSKRQTNSVALLDASGNVVVSFAPQNPYQCVVVTAPAIQQGQTYTIVTGGTVADADANGFAQNTSLTGGQTVDSITMTELLYGGSGGMRNRPGGGGGGGWRGW